MVDLSSKAIRRMKHLIQFQCSQMEREAFHIKLMSLHSGKISTLQTENKLIKNLRRTASGISDSQNRNIEKHKLLMFSNSFVLKRKRNNRHINNNATISEY
jgi:hypothetical protein